MDWNTIKDIAEIATPVLVVITFLYTQRDASKIKEKISDFSERIGRLEGFLIGNKDSTGEQFTQRKSPITLTDEGENVLKESKANKYLNDNFDSLYKAIKDKSSNYRIEQGSREVLQDRFKNIESIHEDYLYNKGKSIYSLVEVMSIELRDMVIKQKEQTEAESKN